MPVAVSGVLAGQLGLHRQQHVLSRGVHVAGAVVAAIAVVLRTPGAWVLLMFCAVAVFVAAWLHKGFVATCVSAGHAGAFARQTPAFLSLWGAQCTPVVQTL